MHVVNFLDITLDLPNNTYKLYRKPDSHPFYINKSSNHPKKILRELAKSIGKGLSDLSPNKEILQKETPIYFETLKKVALMNLNFSHQIPAIKPVKNNENAK